MLAMPESELSQKDSIPMPGSDQQQIADLAVRAVAGDKQAFESLYRQHVNRVYGLCLRLSADTHLAESLTQDTFVRAWTALDGYSGTGSFGGWLSRIATNLWRDRFRTHSRHERLLQRLAEEGLAPTSTVGTMASGSNAGNITWLPTRDPGWNMLTAIELESAMAALPAGARTVFVLHDIEGYKHNEIAELLNVTAGTTKAQLHRARRLLRGLLSNEEEAANGA